MRWLVPALLAACALPPDVDDPSTPERAYESLRSALTRRRHDRAYALLSDRLRRKLGVESRAQFKDGMVVIADDLAVRALGRSRAKGPAERLPDGRALLRVRVSWLFWGKDVRVWLRPIRVLRIYEEGRDAPVFYEHVAERPVEERGAVGVRLPEGALEHAVAALEHARRFEWAVEWFLDDFEVGAGAAPRKGAGSAREKPE